jgi:predicted ferric reductase
MEWIIIRGSGIAAFTLLSAATIWGLLVSSKLLGRLVKTKALTWFHESLGIGALLATGIHVLVLSIHDYVEFAWLEILVPGRSDWSPLPVAFGVTAMYGLVIVGGSFYVKKWIGQKMWRAIHFASIGVFASSMLHGITAGTDTMAPLMIGLYLASASLVTVLIALRLLQVAPNRGAGRQATVRSPSPEETEVQPRGGQQRVIQGDLPDDLHRAHVRSS